MEFRNLFIVSVCACFSVEFKGIMRLPSYFLLLGIIPGLLYAHPNAGVQSHGAGIQPHTAGRQSASFFQTLSMYYAFTHSDSGTGNTGKKSKRLKSAFNGRPATTQINKAGSGDAHISKRNAGHGLKQSRRELSGEDAWEKSPIKKREDARGNIRLARGMHKNYGLVRIAGNTAGETQNVSLHEWVDKGRPEVIPFDVQSQAGTKNRSKKTRSKQGADKEGKSQIQADQTIGDTQAKPVKSRKRRQNDLTPVDLGECQACENLGEVCVYLGQQRMSYECNRYELFDTNPAIIGAGSGSGRQWPEAAEHPATQHQPSYCAETRTLTYLLKGVLYAISLESESLKGDFRVTDVQPAGNQVFIAILTDKEAQVCSWNKDTGEMAVIASQSLTLSDEPVTSFHLRLSNPEEPISSGDDTVQCFNPLITTTADTTEIDTTEIDITDVTTPLFTDADGSSGLDPTVETEEGTTNFPTTGAPAPPVVIAPIASTLRKSGDHCVGDPEIKFRCEAEGHEAMEFGYYYYYGGFEFPEYYHDSIRYDAYFVQDAFLCDYVQFLSGCALNSSRTGIPIGRTKGVLTASGGRMEGNFTVSEPRNNDFAGCYNDLSRNWYREFDGFAIKLLNPEIIDVSIVCGTANELVLDLFLKERDALVCVREFCADVGVAGDSRSRVLNSCSHSTRLIFSKPCDIRYSSRDIEVNVNITTDLGVIRSQTITVKGQSAATTGQPVTATGQSVATTGQPATTTGQPVTATDLPSAVPDQSVGGDHNGAAALRKYWSDVLITTMVTYALRTL